MKKIFTIAIALMASVAMMAADFEPTAVYKVGDATTLGAQWKSANQTANYFESGDTVIFSPYLLYQSAATDWQEWTGCAGSGSTGTSWNATGCFKGSSAWYTKDAKAATIRSNRQYFYNVTNCSEVSILVKSGSSSVIALSAYELNAGVVDSASVVSQTYNTGSNGILTLTGLNMTKTYRIVVNSNKDSNSSYYEIAFVGKASTDPVLNVAPASIKLNVTAAVPAPSAKVVFSGKNLAAGEYMLNTPKLAGLSAAPASVTVGEDGKLNAEVTISYTSAVEVAATSTTIGLTISGLTKNVTVNYSAVLEKKYMTSVNIEQLVLNNGTKYDIKAALDAANIEYNNIDVLDSLNDDKDYRNYPYLGLKMKKTDAKLAGWLKQGQTIKVRFGNVGANFKVSAMGMDSTCTAANFANKTTDSNKVLEFTAPVDMYLTIICNSTSTLVIKQIMVNQEIAPVVLPAQTKFKVTCKEAENGQLSLEANKKTTSGFFAPGTEVKVYSTPAEGYMTVSLTWNGTQLHDEAVGYVTFIMPAEDVTVVAQFDTEFPTAVEDIQAEKKAVKVIENGQMYIIKNGVKYDALGQIVK